MNQLSVKLLNDEIKSGDSVKLSVDENWVLVIVDRK
jgi:hypothetical protein